jgi:hypothetical protein
MEFVSLRGINLSGILVSLLVGRLGSSLALAFKNSNEVLLVEAALEKVIVKLLFGVRGLQVVFCFEVLEKSFEDKFVVLLNPSRTRFEPELV